MQENKFIGEWILQPEKSAYDVGNAPLSASYIFRAIEGDKLAVTIDWKNFDESEQSISYVINPDGCMYGYDGGDVADMVKAEFRSQNILETSVFKNGGLMAFTWREIINNNEMKVLQTSYVSDGGQFDKVQFYKRNILTD
jgi:hypothetical protein